jgi:hypothetical protein
VREDVESEIVLQKNATSFDENGAAVLAIEPGDTEGLEFGITFMTFKSAGGRNVGRSFPSRGSAWKGGDILMANSIA